MQRVCLIYTGLQVPGTVPGPAHGTMGGEAGGGGSAARLMLPVSCNPCVLRVAYAPGDIRYSHCFPFIFLLLLAFPSANITSASVGKI